MIGSRCECSAFHCCSFSFSLSRPSALVWNPSWKEYLKTTFYPLKFAVCYCFSTAFFSHLIFAYWCHSTQAAHTHRINIIRFGVENSTHRKIFERLFAHNSACTEYRMPKNMLSLSVCVWIFWTRCGPATTKKRESEIVIKYAKHSTPLKIINSTMEMEKRDFSFTFLTRKVWQQFVNRFDVLEGRGRDRGWLRWWFNDENEEVNAKW